MITLTEDETTRLLEEIVEEYGENYVYPDGTCQYFRDDGTCACLIGHLLARKGLTPEDVTGQNKNGVTALHAAGLISAPAPLLTALRVAQNAQDRDETWGVALLKYKDTLANYPRKEPS